MGGKAEVQAKEHSHALASGGRDARPKEPSPETHPLPLGLTHGEVPQVGGQRRLRAVAPRTPKPNPSNGPPGFGRKGDAPIGEDIDLTRSNSIARLGEAPEIELVFPLSSPGRLLKSEARKGR
eukprot:14036412-Alexandrium_andersonii.AAC.1